MKHFQIKHMLQCLLVTSSFAIVACGTSTSTENTSDSSSTAMDTTASSATPVTHAEAVITGTKADTTVDGVVTFDADSGKLKMKLELTVPKLANKSVAVHIHEHPDCGDNGMATHGHWNPTHMPHGEWGVDS